MKKFVFAIQVFGIIAMFPIYVILEMNHGAGRFPGSESDPFIKKQSAIRASLNSEAQNENSVRLNYLWVQELRVVRTK